MASSSSSATTDLDSQVSVKDLPLNFKVKYIGSEVARGLWGIKYTRRPVDIMVNVAKNLPPNKVLPQCNLTVSTEGVSIEIITTPMPPTATTSTDTTTTAASTSKPTPKITSIAAATSTKTHLERSWKYAIDTISYGVQDLVYTRVFAMIVVKDDQNPHPFEVHAFVCDSRAMARKLTFALAAAFQDYSRRVKENGGKPSKTNSITVQRQKFAIDLRTPEELREGGNEETEA